jgi:hypothetical protein
MKNDVSISQLKNPKLRTFIDFYKYIKDYFTVRFNNY